MARLRRMSGAAWVGITAVLATWSIGCETLRSANCDPSAAANPEIVYDGGASTACSYASSQAGPSGTPFDGELLFWKGGTHYALDHHMRCAPSSIQAYVSFDQYGTRDGGTLGLAAGEQVLILGADDNAIHVANDSCADYWLLVVASAQGSCALCP